MVKIKIKFLLLIFVFLSLFFQTAFSQNVSLKEIYEKKLNAVRNLDVDEFAKYVPSNVTSIIKSRENPQKTMEMLRYHSVPVEYTVVSEKITSADTAIMEIKGKKRKFIIDLSKEKEGAIENFTAVIHFKKEGNSWIISKEEFE